MATDSSQLTSLLQGRSISGTSDSNGKKTIKFDDGSVLTLIVEDSGTNSASTGGSVESVRQEGNTLSLEFAGGGNITFSLAEETGSVELRDTDDKTVYSN